MRTRPTEAVVDWVDRQPADSVDLTAITVHRRGANPRSGHELTEDFVVER
jgi:hypothetical protein